MRYSRRNIYFHELIGLDIKVIEYPDPSIVGLEGRVVDETFKTFLVEKKDGGFIRVFKNHGVFQFITPDHRKFLVRGPRILGRPEDRLKKIVR